MQPKDSACLSGYRHPVYAESFAGVGTPRELPHCGGWIVERAVPQSDCFDAMGCYPVFSCQRWDNLPLDLPVLGDRLVTLMLVPDPFGGFTQDTLRRWFDIVVPYKQHYVTDLDRPIDQIVAKGHTRSARRSLRRIQVDVCPEPLRMLDDWTVLYSHLVVRHGITGVRAFSRAAFARQLTVPGLIMFRAVADGCVIGLHLWYVQGDIAYAHLGATSPRGYELMASYALHWSALEHLRGRVRWLDLGSSAGAPDGDSGRGLRQFKAGWATDTRQTYVCGRIFQPDVYARLASLRGTDGTSYFPAYRVGEFATTRGSAVHER